MTVSTIDSVAEFDTNGATINYPFYFKFLANEDLVVTYVSPAGISSVLALGTNYTVNGAGNEQGGSIVTTSALAGPGKLIVSREMDAFQQTSLRNQGKFLAETHEDVFDRLTMLIQQGFSIFKRALTRPFGRDYFYAENRRITSVKDPEQPQDAATKSWSQVFFGGLIGAIQGPINNALNVLFVAPSGMAGVVQDMSSTTDMMKGVSYIGGAGRVVSTVADIMALPVLGSKTATALGYYVPGDTGGGTYMYVSGSTATVNGGTVLSATGGIGRWLLCQETPPTLKQFGCKGDYNGVTGTDDTAGFLAAVNTGKPFNIGDGRFLVSPIGPTVTYPGSKEANRTSGAPLSTGQCVFGLGAGRSELVWGNATTKQAFFGMRASTDIMIAGIKFTGGYAPFIVDPTSNGSVQRVCLFKCTVNGCITGPIAGRQLALDIASKSCADISMLDCIVQNVTVHGWISSNCDRPRVDGTKFFNINGGFAADFSQGCRSPKFTNNHVQGALHGFKFESSNSYAPGGQINVDPTIAETRDGIATGNHLMDIQQFGAYLNSGCNGHIIANNRLEGSFTIAIYLGAVTGYSNAGQCIIEHNVLTLNSINATGIRSDFIHPTMGVIVDANTIKGGVIGIDWRAPRGKLSNNSGTVDSLGIQLGVLTDYLDICNNTIYAKDGIASTAGGDWKGLRLHHNKLFVSTGFGIYLGTLNSLSDSELDGNKINNSTVRSEPAVIIPNPRGVRITAQKFNLAAGSGAGLATSGTALKSIIALNIGTTANSIAGSDSTTTANTVNNITDAAFVAY